MKKLLIICIAAIASLSISAQSTTPQDTVDIVCYDLELNTDFIDLFGMVYIFANNSEYKLTGAIYADSIPPGTYTNCVMDITHIATRKQIPAVSVEITLGRDDKNFCVITGYMLGEDNVLYNLDLSWQTPTATNTIPLSFDQCSQVAYYPDLGHDFMLSNENEQYAVSIDIVQVPMGETFTERNLNTAYCMIANKATQDTIKIAAAEGRVWQSNDTTYLYTLVTGFDSVLYDIKLWYAVPQSTQTLQIDIQNATFYNELASDGYYALVGTTKDKKYEFAISLLGNTEEDIPGTYTNDGLFGAFSGQNYDFLHFIGGQYTTYIAKWNNSKKEYDIVSIEKGQTTITMDENQNIQLQGSFIGADSITYQVTLTSKVDKPRIIDDATSGEINRTFTNEKQITIEQQEEDKVLLDIMTDSDLLALWFYVDHIDEDIIIPEGEYAINSDNDYWTVMAADGSLGKTFYATHDGEYFTSFYFLIDGTVVISKKNGKLHFEMNALNSYDVPVHIVYSPSTTDIEYTDLQPQEKTTKKLLIKDQLIIERNGQRHNIMGTCIK